MPWTMSSSLSSPQSCGPVLRLISTSAEIRYSASPAQHSSRSLDSSSWQKQVCEVRPNRSSTLGRFPVFQQSTDAGECVSADKTTVMASRLDSVISPSVTVTKTTDEFLERAHAGRPLVRTSSDFCHCYWPRAASTVSPPTHLDRCRDFHRRAVHGDVAAEDDREGRRAYGDAGLRQPPSPLPSPPPFQISSTVTSVTSPTTQNVSVHVGEVHSYGPSPVRGSCHLHVGAAQLRTPDLGICSATVDGSSRHCLEDIREVDETSAVDQPSPPKPLTDHQTDPRRQTTSCTLTTFV